MLEEERSWPGNTSLPLDPEFGCYASDDFTWRTWIHRFTHKAGRSFWAGIFQTAYWHHNSWCEFSRPQAAFEYTHTHARTHTRLCSFALWWALFIFHSLYICAFTVQFGLILYKMRSCEGPLGRVNLVVLYDTAQMSAASTTWEGVVIGQ